MSDRFNFKNIKMRIEEGLSSPIIKPYKHSALFWLTPELLRRHKKKIDIKQFGEAAVRTKDNRRFPSDWIDLERK